MRGTVEKLEILHSLFKEQSDHFIYGYGSRYIILVTILWVARDRLRCRELREVSNQRFNGSKLLRSLRLKVWMAIIGIWAYMWLALSILVKDQKYIKNFSQIIHQKLYS